MDARRDALSALLGQGKGSLSSLSVRKTSPSAGQKSTVGEEGTSKVEHPAVKGQDTLDRMTNQLVTGQRITDVDYAAPAAASMAERKDALSALLGKGKGSLSSFSAHDHVAAKGQQPAVKGQDTLERMTNQTVPQTTTVHRFSDEDERFASRSLSERTTALAAMFGPTGAMSPRAASIAKAPPSPGRAPSKGTKPEAPPIPQKGGSAGGLVASEDDDSVDPEHHAANLHRYLKGSSASASSPQDEASSATGNSSTTKGQKSAPPVPKKGIGSGTFLYFPEPVIAEESVDLDEVESVASMFRVEPSKIYSQMLTLTLRDSQVLASTTSDVNSATLAKKFQSIGISSKYVAPLWLPGIVPDACVTFRTDVVWAVAWRDKLSELITRGASSPSTPTMLQVVENHFYPERDSATTASTRDEERWDADILLSVLTPHEINASSSAGDRNLPSTSAKKPLAAGIPERLSNMMKLVRCPRAYLRPVVFDTARPSIRAAPYTRVVFHVSVTHDPLLWPQLRKQCVLASVDDVAEHGAVVGESALFSEIHPEFAALSLFETSSSRHSRPAANKTCANDQSLFPFPIANLRQAHDQESWAYSGKVKHDPGEENRGHFSPKPYRTLAEYVSHNPDLLSNAELKGGIHVCLRDLLLPTRLTSLQQWVHRGAHLYVCDLLSRERARVRVHIPHNQKKKAVKKSVVFGEILQSSKDPADADAEENVVRERGSSKHSLLNDEQLSQHERSTGRYSSTDDFSSAREDNDVEEGRETHRKRTHSSSSHHGSRRSSKSGKRHHLYFEVPTALLAPFQTTTIIQKNDVVRIREVHADARYHEDLLTLRRAAACGAELTIADMSDRAAHIVTVRARSEFDPPFTVPRIPTHLLERAEKVEAAPAKESPGVVVTQGMKNKKSTAPTSTETAHLRLQSQDAASEARAGPTSALAKRASAFSASISRENRTRAMEAHSNASSSSKASTPGEEHLQASLHILKTEVQDLREVLATSLDELGEEAMAQLEWQISTNPEALAAFERERENVKKAHQEGGPSAQKASARRLVDTLLNTNTAREGGITGSLQLEKRANTTAASGGHISVQIDTARSWQSEGSENQHLELLPKSAGVNLGSRSFAAPTGRDLGSELPSASPSPMELLSSAGNIKARREGSGVNLPGDHAGRNVRNSRQDVLDARKAQRKLKELQAQTYGLRDALSG
ncbi:unnamed protein product [Amoebophrya sp. A120]|nr:unnamed protein product [Amoebophrya sp. A120]|eukprot:GSA120T00005412001.1